MFLAVTAQFPQATSDSCYWPPFKSSPKTAMWEPVALRFANSLYGSMFERDKFPQIFKKSCLEEGITLGNI